MIIKVTQSHIDQGCRGDGQACPVALAITEATGCTCIVEPQYITLNPYSVDFVVVRTPLVVTKFIAAYDVSVEVEPFEFELDVKGVGWMAEILTDHEINQIRNRANLGITSDVLRLIASHRALAAERNKLKSALEEIAGSHFANEFHDGTPTGPAAIEHLHRIANKALKVEQLEGAIKHG